MGREQQATAAEILGVCRRLELGASEVYERFAGRTEDPGLAAAFRKMSEQEAQHAAAVGRLLDRGDIEIPVLSRAELDALVGRVDAVRRDANVPGLDVPAMLVVATALELSEMDELFGMACRAGGIDPDVGRADHLSGLVEAAARLGATAGAVRHILASIARFDRRAPAN